MADPDDVERLGEALYHAMISRHTMAPLVGRVHDLDTAMAYRIAAATLRHRIGDGERVVGYKVGLTSRAIQERVGAREPDFGTLTDAMWVGSAATTSTLALSSRTIQPMAEGEIALRLARDLLGPGIGPEEVRAATASVHPCFEIVDSRIEGWKIRVLDTIADNASSALFAVGPGVPATGLDLEGCRMEVQKNRAALSEGFGRAAFGSPLLSAAWLINSLGARGVPVRAGQWVLTGSLVPLEPVAPGDTMALSIDGIGRLSVTFS